MMNTTNDDSVPSLRGAADMLRSVADRAQAQRLGHEAQLLSSVADLLNELCRSRSEKEQGALN